MSTKKTVFKTADICKLTKNKTIEKCAQCTAFKFQPLPIRKDVYNKKQESILNPYNCCDCGRLDIVQSSKVVPMAFFPHFEQRINLVHTCSYIIAFLLLSLGSLVGFFASPFSGHRVYTQQSLRTPARFKQMKLAQRAQNFGSMLQSIFPVQVKNF